MTTNKLFLFAAAFVLLAGSYAGAVAQGKMDQTDSSGRLPPQESTVSTVRIQAIEITVGTPGTNTQTNRETGFGHSFVGQTTGDMPGSLTLSINFAPSIPVPGESSDLTGGSWSLPVYRNEVRGGHAGSLYGTIASGSISWDTSGSSATVYIVLNVEGGTVHWDGAQGQATFAGTLLFGDRGQKTALNGDMEVTLLGTAAAGK